MRGEEIEQDDENPAIPEILASMTSPEIAHLRTIIDEFRDRKPVTRSCRLSFISSNSTQDQGRTWLEHGCIVFSQYYDTGLLVCTELARTIKGEPVAVYAGAGKSGIFKDGEFASVDREEIKKAVKDRKVRLILATDAACEGLNLQTLGTLINVDLPSESFTPRAASG